MITFYNSKYSANYITEEIDRLVEIQLEVDNFTDYNVKIFGALRVSGKMFVI